MNYGDFLNYLRRKRVHHGDTKGMELPGGKETGGIEGIGFKCYPMDGAHAYADFASIKPTAAFP
jgi:hypothetical protein